VVAGRLCGSWARMAATPMGAEPEASPAGISRRTDGVLLVYRSGWQRHKAIQVLTLSRAQIGDDSRWIVSERLGVGVPDGTDLVDDRIEYGFLAHACSSSGVQIVGGCRPCERHSDSSLARICAFAM